MKAAYLQNSQIHVGEVPDPIPAKGQALVRTHSCGLCASDAHFVHLGAKVVEISRQYGGPYSNLDLSQIIVPGHEYVGEILDYGPGSRRPLKVGAKVTSQPVMRHAGGHSVIGQSHDCPGGFGEYMLLDENTLMEVPSDLDDDLAAMTEPLAVGLEHARSGEPTRDDVPLVIGCGAIGLGVIAGLKLMDMGPIIAADFDENRRNIAIRMGADVVIDPRELSPYGPIHGLGNRRATLIYECVGKPGLLNQIMNSVGFGARIVIGGFCLEPEPLYVPSGQMRRLKIFFAAGEEQQDLDLALRSIVDGKVDIKSWLGGRIGLSGVAAALDAMSSAAAPVRTVVDPRRM
ncbi:MAG: theronine dehydrogenase [Hydrocarboniphaga sp.]|uniref:zinc-binding dehydrogenase n=1 Tax=Hydrocarboniphaga sp. TaxID=2033016 RepID=UPI00262241D5|nr:zinc-binding dehydrogenase [Hydrocarboniphaga sp.]MDB5972183.1 theronine dehydrogenase [Hydrocarboniphaga sp.]